MNLIHFETYAEGWRFARLANPYYSDGGEGYLVNLGGMAGAAIIDFVEEREQTQRALWDLGSFVYGLS